MVNKPKMHSEKNWEHIYRKKIGTYLQKKIKTEKICLRIQQFKNHLLRIVNQDISFNILRLQLTNDKGLLRRKIVHFNLLTHVIEIHIGNHEFV